MPTTKSINSLPLTRRYKKVEEMEERNIGDRAERRPSVKGTEAEIMAMGIGGAG